MALAQSEAGAGPGFDLARELRPKNAYNLLRLLVTAARWLRDGVRARHEALHRGPVVDGNLNRFNRMRSRHGCALSQGAGPVLDAVGRKDAQNGKSMAA